MQNQNNHKRSRRQFLNNSAKLGAMIPILASPTLSLGMDVLAKKEVQKRNSSTPLKILILGGTTYLGPHQIAYALKRGHSVTTFTRGKSKPTIHKELFKEVEALIGDREDNLEALKGRKWDVVIDNSGRKIKWTKDTAELLRDSANLYLYVSSVSVNYPYTGTDFSEDRKLVLSTPPELTDEDSKAVYGYGVMKANSELEAIKAFGKDRTVVVRPSFIVGPADPKNRFVYWPVRLEKGGEILVPGKANDPVQFIDARDLAGWMIRLLENRTTGTFNAAGPATPMTVSAFVHGAHAAFSSPISYVPIDDYDFLEEHGVSFMCPWVLPKGNYAGMCLTQNQRAIASGLTFTPLAKTMTDIMDWWYSDAVTEERRVDIVEDEGNFMTREKAVIAAWREKISK